MALCTILGLAGRARIGFDRIGAREREAIEEIGLKGKDMVSVRILLVSSWTRLSIHSNEYMALYGNAQTSLLLAAVLDYAAPVSLPHASGA